MILTVSAVFTTSNKRAQGFRPSNLRCRVSIIKRSLLGHHLIDSILVKDGFLFRFELFLVALHLFTIAKILL